MTAERSRLLLSLMRVERLLPAFDSEVTTAVKTMICEARALPVRIVPPTEEEPSLPPLRHFKPKARKLNPPPPDVETPKGRPLPPAPKARPLLNRLQPKKAPHLFLVPDPPPGLEAALDPKAAPPDPMGERMREAEGARALLLEIVRRAAYDWVLYRGSSRLDQKLLAEDAYTWLFLEDEEHPNWWLREQDEKILTAFIPICKELDLDPDRVRAHIRNLTPNKVMSSGRPPENSRASDHIPSIQVHADVPDSSGGEGSFDFDSLLGSGGDFD